jgi:hypothetical protein
MARLEVIEGDITRLDVDAIVNAPTNRCWAAAASMARSIAPQGPELLAECRTLHGCPTGEARITKGYRLKARHVIHTVGPIWQGGKSNEPELLAALLSQQPGTGRAAWAEEHRLPGHLDRRLRLSEGTCHRDRRARSAPARQGRPRDLLLLRQGDGRPLPRGHCPKRFAVLR